MRKLSIVSFLLFLLIHAPWLLSASGLTSNDNFLVQAPNQELALKIAQRANEYRSQVATDWLGADLPVGQGSTSLHVRISKDDRSGHFWPTKAGERRMHRLWLVSTEEECVGTWLKRNIVHVVLETAHPGTLPPAIKEGIAATYDDESLEAQRHALLGWFQRTNRWPSMATLLRDKALNETDRGGLAAAASLVEFLLTQSDQQTLLDFAMAGHTGDWPDALERFYGIQSEADLQRRWQDWVATSLQGEKPNKEFVDPKYRISEHDVAIAISENFTIYAQDRQMCLQLLETAEKLRDRIAREWLGEQLPPGVGHVIVRISLSDTEDRASSWVQDGTDRASHMVWVTTAPDKVQSALAHEITHAVLATRFAMELPVWAQEAAASREDDARRKSQRDVVLHDMSHSGVFGDVEALLNAPRVDHNDLRAYSTAASLGKLLESKGGKPKLLQFAVDGKRIGWNRALQAHYKITDVAELQFLWQQSVSTRPQLYGQR